MTPQPYIKRDLERGEQIVRELYGLLGYDAWAEHIAKAIAAEREAVLSKNETTQNAMELYLVCYLGASGCIVLDQSFTSELEARTYAYNRQQEKQHMTFLILKACPAPS